MIHWGFLILAFIIGIIIGLVICYFITKLAELYGEVIATTRGALD